MVVTKLQEITEHIVQEIVRRTLLGPFGSVVIRVNLCSHPSLLNSRRSVDNLYSVVSIGSARVLVGL